MRWPNPYCAHCCCRCCFSCMWLRDGVSLSMFCMLAFFLAAFRCPLLLSSISCIFLWTTSCVSASCSSPSLPFSTSFCLCPFMFNCNSSIPFIFNQNSSFPNSAASSPPSSSPLIITARHHQHQHHHYHHYHPRRHQQSQQAYDKPDCRTVSEDFPLLQRRRKGFDLVHFAAEHRWSYTKTVAIIYVILLTAARRWLLPHA